MGDVPEGRTPNDLGGLGREVQARYYATRLDKARRMVEALERALSEARWFLEEWEESASQDSLSSTQLRPSGSAVEWDALTQPYFCTLQVANRDALIQLLHREQQIIHTCPAGHKRTRVVVMDDIIGREPNWQLRCGCPNKNCWVFQYTEPDKTPTEHKGA